MERSLGHRATAAVEPWPAATPAGAPRSRRTPSPRAILVVASLGVFMVFVDATVVNIAFPALERSFPASSIATLSWVLNAYNIAFAAFLLVGGRVADLFGRRRVFRIGLVLFTLASLICAAAPSVGALIAGRVLQGIGATLLVPASLGLVVNAFSAERRAHGVALWAAVGALAAGVGPSLGGFLVWASTWRLVFLVNIPVGIAGYVLARGLLVENRTPGRRSPPDVWGGLLAATAVGTLVLAIVEGPDWGWWSPPTGAAFTVAVAATVLLAARSAGSDQALVDPSLLRSRPVAVASLAMVIASIGFFGYTLCNVLYLTGVWQYSALRAGLALTPGPLVAVVLAGPSSRVASRIGHRPVLVAGGLIWGGALLWFPTRVGPAPDFLGEWLPGMVLLGIGAGILFPNLSAAGVAGAPGRQFAMATALNSVARQIGAAIGVAVAVDVLSAASTGDVLTGFHHAWLVASACLVTAGLCSAAIGRLDLTAAERVATPPAAPERASGAPPDGEGRVELTGRVSPSRPRLSPPRPSGTEDGAPESTAEFLARVPLLAVLDPEMCQTLAARTRTVRLSAGEWLCRAGDPAGEMYVVRSGRLEVISDGATPAVLRVLGRGDTVGELGLVLEAPRTASVRCARDSELVAIGATAFLDVARQAPEVWRGVSTVLAGHLTARSGPRQPRPAFAATIALVPLELGAPADRLAHALGIELGGGRNVAVLRAPERAPHDGDGASVFGPLLDRCEAAHRQVILVAGVLSSPDPWTAFCLQHADRVVAVTRGGAADTEVARRVDLRDCSLVGCDVDMGSGRLAAWAGALQPATTQVLRTGRAGVADVGRLARRLGGRSVGLVLSGGGARALAHLGVVEELLGAGVVVDRVAGVSMGAFIGALLAMEMGAAEIDAHCYDGWVRDPPLTDYTLPVRGLIRGERAKAMLRSTFGAVRLEELPCGYRCTSTDLRRGELVVHRDGPLWEQVAASLCLPVIAPPIVRQKQILVDGSLVDNLPTSVLAGTGEGPIIAVDVRGPMGRSGRNPDGVPALRETLARVLLLAAANSATASGRDADVVIRPRVHGIGLLEFHQIDAAREAGRSAARHALESGALAGVC